MPSAGSGRHPGEILVIARENLGLSQRQVARAAGIAAGGLADVELGSHAPNMRTLQLLAPILQLTIVIAPGGVVWTQNGQVL